MCIAVRKVATPLRELTCHMGSHSVTCHPAEVTFPLAWALPQLVRAEPGRQTHSGSRKRVYIVTTSFVLLSDRVTCSITGHIPRDDIRKWRIVSSAVQRRSTKRPHTMFSTSPEYDDRLSSVVGHAFHVRSHAVNRRLAVSHSRPTATRLPSSCCACPLCTTFSTWPTVLDTLCVYVCTSCPPLLFLRLPLRTHTHLTAPFPGLPIGEPVPER